MDTLLAFGEEPEATQVSPSKSFSSVLYSGRLPSNAFSVSSRATVTDRGPDKVVGVEYR